MNKKTGLFPATTLTPNAATTTVGFAKNLRPIRAQPAQTNHTQAKAKECAQHQRKQQRRTFGVCNWVEGEMEVAGVEDQWRHQTPPKSSFSDVFGWNWNAWAELGENVPWQEGKRIKRQKIDRNSFPVEAIKSPRVKLDYPAIWLGLRTNKKISR